MLEKAFGWTGILSEPATVWHDDLVNNRKCYIDFACISSCSGQSLEFNESVSRSSLSGLAGYGNIKRQLKGKGLSTYTVPTLSLNDLLDKCQAPLVVDYISIDTEGNEFDILKTFDF